MRILISGGLGFVGSSLARMYRKSHPRAEIIAFDNLKRRGSELNIAGLARIGVQFYHGDIRVPADLEDLPGQFDLFVEASAEPSVLAGLDGSPNYLLQTNLVGTLHCLEFARRRAAQMLFLSTSRVYSIDPLRAIRLEEEDKRLSAAAEQALPGISPKGIAETFPTDTFRSLYGATKLASEMILQEYAATYDYNAVVNRCGVIAGPGQFGKVDQGVFTMWVANHFYGKPLRFIGFGGTGKQVRDLLHPADLFALLEKQREAGKQVQGQVFNIGGGQDVSTSLLELTEICQNVTGKEVAIGSISETTAVDIPYYVTDSTLAENTFGWRPERGVHTIVSEIHTWLKENESMLKPIFNP